MIVGRNIKVEISKSIKQCVVQCYIATAYCTTRAYEKILVDQLCNVLNKIIFLRWELKDLVLGASDLEVYPLAKRNGWQVYINQKLHAKVYRFDNDCFIGSANLTQSGLAGADVGLNIETVAKVAVDESIETWFTQLINGSRLLDDELYQLIQNDVDSFEGLEEGISDIRYSVKTAALIEAKAINSLYTKDFIWSESPKELLADNIENIKSIEHDMALLGLNRATVAENICITFHQSKAFHWLFIILEEKREIYFGELSALLHDVLQDDPAPYRKSVKILLNSLINWVEYCSSEVLIVDKPKHSARLRLVKTCV